MTTAPDDATRRGEEAPVGADADAGPEEPGAAGDGTSEDTAGGSDDATGRRGAGQDLRSILRQLTSPVVESLDARLRDQIEAHVDELMDEKIAAALRDRLSTLDRAIADLSRSLGELEHRVEAIERGSDPSTP
jgi:hypothetical protein